ncbi:MAG: ATP synthase F1 subunit delta [Oscillospiraceae bacterium]|nr:ATP synthase F1 subunit delta [Oscillospiraceae bacterium]
MIDAVDYAQALYDLAAERGTEDRVRRELQIICQALQEQPDYTRLMDTPAVGSGEKCDLLRQAFAGVEEMLQNFLCILCEKRSFYRLPACAKAYEKAFDAAHNILRATAITATPMVKRQQQALCKKLSAMTNKTVELENTVDPTLIGGIRLRYEGVQLDDSIQSRLETMRRALAQTIV